MNNRYIFRGKRKDNKEWIYGGIYYQKKDEIKEVYSGLDREKFPKGVYKCEVSAYLIDGDGELYSLLTGTVGDRTAVGIKTDIENMYATRGEAEAALREKEAGE